MMIEPVVIPHRVLMRTGVIAALVTTMIGFSKHFRRDCLVVLVVSIGVFK